LQSLEGDLTNLKNDAGSWIDSHRAKIRHDCA